MQLADPTTNSDAKMKLAEFHKIIGEPRKALDLVYEENSTSLYYPFISKIIIVIDAMILAKNRGK